MKNNDIKQQKHKCIMRHPFILPPHSIGIAKDMTSVYEYILKKPHWEGERNAACCLNLPKKFVDQIGIDRQSYLKVTYMNDQHKLVVEKLEDQNPQRGIV